VYGGTIKEANLQLFCENNSRMNFLAHLLLSGNNEGILMGNYGGDFVKGLLTEEKTRSWNPEYVVGLKLHRYIDSFTDTHPVVRQAKAKVAENHGRLSGIIIDIYFDYFLAKFFADFCNETLWKYAHRMYSVIEKNGHLIPEQMIPMSNAMIRQDWLNSYASLDGIDLTFGRMSRRADFMLPIRNAVEDLRNNEAFYQDKFLLFFPAVQDATEHFLGEHYHI
jgi:acyl carrier protein phosphodiesterase